MNTLSDLRTLCLVLSFLLTAPGRAASPAAPGDPNVPAEGSIAAPAEVSRSVSVGFFSNENKGQFKDKVQPFFEKQTHNCKTCKIVDLTPYDEKGEYSSAGLEAALKDLPPAIKIIFFNFNLKRTEIPAGVLDLLNKYSTQGLIIVASAGAPKENQSSGPLSKTLFGLVKEALIIGELSERDRLMPQGFYGPEMLAAIRPVKDYQGQGLGPTVFAAKLATNYTRKNPHDWVDAIKTKKQKSRKIWPDLEDFFN